jgi:hypothetical protein
MSQAGIISGGGGGGGGPIDTLTGNTGGAVSPLAGNINVVGDGLTLTVSGNPGTHTLTVIDQTRVTAQVTTVNATPTILYQQVVALDTILGFNATITAIDSTSSQGAISTFVAAAYSNGITNTLVGLPIISISQDFGTPVNINAAIVGVNLAIEVVGVAATTIFWSAVITLIQA